MSQSGRLRQTRGVEVTASIDAPCTPEVLFDLVSSLDTYPEWLSILPRVERESVGAVRGGIGAGDDDGSGNGGAVGPVWTVELRGKIGPLARSKRLRMVRVACEAPRRVRFERRELDGRSHSPWVLEAEVAAVADDDRDDNDEVAVPTSRLVMRLFYGGSFGGSILERMLVDEIEASRPRLLTLVAEVYG